MKEILEAQHTLGTQKTGENWCAGHNGFVAQETYHCIVYSDFCRQLLPTALCVECAMKEEWRRKLRMVKYWYNTRLLVDSYVEYEEEV